MELIKLMYNLRGQGYEETYEIFYSEEFEETFKVMHLRKGNKYFHFLNDGTLEED